MATEQAGSNQPEKIDDAFSAAREAYAELAGKDVVADDKPEIAAEPEVKAEPAEKVVAEAKTDHPTDPKRYADGTFKPGEKPDEPAETKAPVAKVEPAAVETQPAQQQQAPTASGSPPGGFSPRTKAEWEKLPDYVRADILKREKEVADGFAQYEGMRELRPYVDLARSQGQTLKQALDRYTGIENSLRQKPLDTILYLAGNAGYPPQRLAMELSSFLVGPQGQQNGAPQNGTQMPFDPSMLQQYLSPLAQEVNQIKSLFQQQQEAENVRYNTAVQAAEAKIMSEPENRYYANVRPDMLRLFQGGVIRETGDHYADLKAAYETACWQNPEIRELLLNERSAKTEAARVQSEKEAGAKARAASRSITGSPSGSVRESDDAVRGNSAHEAARAAYHEVRGRV